MLLGIKGIGNSTPMLLMVKNPASGWVSANTELHMYIEYIFETYHNRRPQKATPSARLARDRVYNPNNIYIIYLLIVVYIL